MEGTRSPWLNYLTMIRIQSWVQPDLSCYFSVILVTHRCNDQQWASVHLFFFFLFSMWTMLCYNLVILLVVSQVFSDLPCVPYVTSRNLHHPLTGHFVWSFLHNDTEIYTFLIPSLTNLIKISLSRWSGTFQRKQVLHVKVKGHSHLIPLLT